MSGIGTKAEIAICCRSLKSQKFDTIFLVLENRGFIVIVVIGVDDLISRGVDDRC